VVNETVKAVRDYLNGLLAQCKTWEEFLGFKFNAQTGIDSAGAFRNTKRDGIGGKTITRFLNSGQLKGNWNHHALILVSSIPSRSRALYIACGVLFNLIATLRTDKPS